MNHPVVPSPGRALRVRSRHSTRRMLRWVRKLPPSGVFLFATPVALVQFGLLVVILVGADGVLGQVLVSGSPFRFGATVLWWLVCTQAAAAVLFVLAALDAWELRDEERSAVSGGAIHPVLRRARRRLTTGLAVAWIGGVIGITGLFIAGALLVMEVFRHLPW